ncbi:MAG: ATP-grasp domain-containing protein [Clostridia bacterium]|nr:ATP-grasp domain-containing protein [Clostridia bacterium]
MKTIAIFYGGRSYEHDISIITAIQAMTYIDNYKYRIIPVYMKDGKLYAVKYPQKFMSYIEFNGAKQYGFINGGLKRGIIKIAVDCALLCTHGGEGENGILEGVLEYYNIPHTAPDSAMSAVGMNKWISKAVFDKLGAATVPGALSEDIETISKLGYPVIVKPVTLGSSIGIEIAHDESELNNALNIAKFYDDSIIVERVVADRMELNCAAFLNDGRIIVSAIEKPVTWQEYLTFGDKYNTSGKVRAEKELPAIISEELTNEVKNTTELIYKALKLCGVVRVDYLYSQKEKKLYINEINTIPGSLAYYLFSDNGLTFSKLIDLIIAEGIRRGNPKKVEYRTDVLKQYISSGSTLKSSK